MIVTGALKWSAASVLSLLTALISYSVNNEVSAPYMDEIFHIPQVQSYCRHNFSHWDPMITTPPGLYLTSLLTIEPVSWLLGNDLCITSLLRAQNIPLLLVCFLVLYGLIESLHFQLTPVFIVSLSLTLSLFPLLFFFVFLYYTDVGSTLTVLLGYLLARKNHHIPASVVLGWSVMFRQTNIVWVGFIAACSLLRHLDPELSKLEKGSSLLVQAVTLFKASLGDLLTILSWAWSYLLLAIGFVLFLVINGGVVMGDKTHHTVSCHLPQLLYFSGFLCLFSAGPLVSRWRLILKSFLSPLCISGFIVLTLFGMVAVHYYTYEHPYLLADNRHFTFYVWKNIFRRHEMIKYILVPVYSVCWLAILIALREHQSIWWTLLFCASCAIVLVPQSLLEFRYYIVPYLLFRLHIKSTPLWSTVLELCFYIIVNGFTFWIFLKRPFKWEGEADQLQRFMW